MPRDSFGGIHCGRADALQLAAAEVWAGQPSAGYTFVCLDHRLRDAASREGFEVMPLMPLERQGTP